MVRKRVPVLRIPRRPGGRGLLLDVVGDLGRRNNRHQRIHPRRCRRRRRRGGGDVFLLLRGSSSGDLVALARDLGVRFGRDGRGRFGG